MYFPGFMPTPTLRFWYKRSERAQDYAFLAISIEDQLYATHLSHKTREQFPLLFCFAAKAVPPLHPLLHFSKTVCKYSHLIHKQPK